MQGCNDCIFDYNGDLWVTAPAGNIAPDPYKRSFDVNLRLLSIFYFFCII